MTQARKWSNDVTEHSDALDLEGGIFEQHDPQKNRGFPQGLG